MKNVRLEEYSDLEISGGIQRFEHDDARLLDLLVGRSVRKVNSDHLVLDNGTVLRVIPNKGCGGCSAGVYGISELNECENVITKAEMIVNDGEYEDSKEYRLFVYAENRSINLLSVEGSDGNSSGFDYGSGFSVIVSPVESFFTVFGKVIRSVHDLSSTLRDIERESGPVRASRISESLDQILEHAGGYELWKSSGHH